MYNNVIFLNILRNNFHFRLRNMSVKPRILFVGSGLTTAVTAYILSQNCANNNKVNHSLTVWEKGKENDLGGRMNTSNSLKNPNCFGDLGAQFISATPAYASSHKHFYDELIKNNLLQPMAVQEIEGLEDKALGVTHYVPPQGMRSIIQHFMYQTNARIKFEHEVNKIEIDVKSLPNAWKVWTNTGESDIFDIVILTMPVPQIMNLHGSVPNILSSNENMKKKLTEVRYSTRYAMALFYEDTNEEPYFPFTAKFINDSDCIRFISVDNKKRKTGDNIPTTLIVHTSTTFGKKFEENKSNSLIQSIIKDELRKIIPNLPEASSEKFVYWQYSQVVTPFENSPGYVVLQEKPLLICAGDGFFHSNFDGCIESSLKLIDYFHIA